MPSKHRPRTDLSSLSQVYTRLHISPSLLSDGGWVESGDCHRHACLNIPKLPLNMDSICFVRSRQKSLVDTCTEAFHGFKEPEEELDLLITATFLGEALWAQARAEHRQDASLTLSMRSSTPNDGTKSLSATGAHALQDAETWLRTALGSRKKSMNLQMALHGLGINWEMTAQMHLACVTFFKGDEDEAVGLLSELLQLMVTVYGQQRCAGCGQVRGQDVPMLVCVECRAVRCACRATHLPCSVMHRLSSLPWNR